MDDLKKFHFSIFTFGCQMNENDSEHIAGILAGAGATKAGSPEASNLIIVNTCAVREKPEKKLYSLLGRLQEIKKKNNAVIGVAGCAAQLQGPKLLESRSPVDFVVGPANYLQLPKILREHPGEKFVSIEMTDTWPEMRPVTMVRESPVSAFVTVMEGCNNFCSYCVVPFARGREKFRPLGNILEEIRDLAQRGYKEVQLLGQNVNSYRDPQSGLRFAFLLKKAGLVAGLEWIRFITSHPKNFDEEIALAMAETKNVCHQLHLPLQSGSSTVLARMNRGYSQEDYLTKVDLLRRLMPDIALSTDIIVGFPGESEKEFEETLAVLDQVRFTNIFSFRYCPRPQTAASQMADDVPPEEKQRRLQEVQELQKKIQVENNRRLLGKTFKILGTGKSKKDKGVYTGRNEAAQVVNFTSSTDPTGCFVQVLITGCGPYSLRGEGSG